MDKTTLETFIAVLAGVILGIIAASAFWITKNTKIDFKKNTEAEQAVKKNPPAKESKNMFSLNTSLPSQQMIVEEKKLDITGKTNTKSLIIVSLGGDDEVIKTDADGNFSLEKTLTPGLNNITITAVNDSDSQMQKQIYSIFYEEK